MFANGITQIVRAQVARAKDAALANLGRDTPASTGAAASGTPVPAVDAPTPIGVRPDSLQSASTGFRQALSQGTNAVIVAALGGQRYLVDIGGEQAAVVLEAAGTAAGRSLTPGAEVRLVLGLETPAAATQGDTHAELSTAARLIAELSQNDSAAARRDATDAGRIITTAPLVDRAVLGSPAGANALANELAGVLDRSGLFYESHVAQWTAGERALETVKQEPQAHRHATGGAMLERAPESAALMREQLQTLSSQTVAWQGPVWRNQPAELEIQRDPEAPENSPEQTWRAKLALELPRLGRVEVSIALAGNRVNLQLGADESRPELIAKAGTLTNRLDAQGLAASARFEALAARKQ